MKLWVSGRARRPTEYTCRRSISRVQWGRKEGTENSLLDDQSGRAGGLLQGKRGFLPQFGFGYCTMATDYSTLSNEDLIAAYQQGAADLRRAAAGMSSEHLLKRVEPGKWSVLEVVCHVADFEVINAERIRRVLAEDEPTLFNGEPDDFERALCYEQRDLDEELNLIEIIRDQTARILRNVPTNAWNHSRGP